MDLRDSQSLFARMAVDAKFREAAFAESGDAAGVFKGLETEVCRSARALINKRKAAVRGVLRNAHRFLRQDFEDEFIEYAENGPEPRGVHRHRLDALAFAVWMTRRVHDGGYPPALLDLLKHETTPLAMWIEGRRFLVRLHWRDPGMLSGWTRKGRDLAAAPVRPAIVFWRVCRNADGGYRWWSLSL